jgi:L-lactate permease
MPVLAYAAYMLVLFLLDSFRGDGLILHQYVFESRRQLALQVLSDSRQALPVFYAVTLLLWAEITLLSRFNEWSGVLPALLVGVLTAFALAALLVEMSWGAVVPSVISGLLLSLALVWAIRPSRSRG